MNHRTEARVIPSAANVIEVRLPSGVYHFVLPSQRSVWSALQKIPGDGAAKVIGALDSAGIEADTFGVLMAAWGDSVAAALGYLIGRTWYHVDLDLDAVPGDDLGAFGLAVWDELEASGIPYAEVVALGCAVLRTIVDATKVDVEGLRRADFFGPTKAKSGAGTSPSRVPTSATPGHGTGSATTSAPTSSPLASLTVS